MTKLEAKKYVVTFLPWLKLRDSLEVNDVLFWPFPNGRSEVHLGRSLASELRRIFRGYRDPEGRPIEELTVVSLKDDPFKDLSDEDIRKISATIRLLAFSLIAENEYYRQGGISIQVTFSISINASNSVANILLLTPVAEMASPGMVATNMAN